MQLPSGPDDVRPYHPAVTANIQGVQPSSPANNAV